MKLKLVIIIFLLTAFLTAGCVRTGPLYNEKACDTSSDCACGVHKTTGDCFYGNKDYVDTLKQCPDFCGGIGGNLDLICVSNECKQISTSEEKYCDVDSDCVRKNSCCDCGLGVYINKKYQTDVECKGPQCACPIALSVGKCVANMCTGVKKEVLEREDFCGTSTFGSCQTSNDCVSGGCSGQVCQSKDEEPVITICDLRDCYNPRPYNLKCQCFENKCQWR